jgi:hypothetical protein
VIPAAPSWVVPPATLAAAANAPGPELTPAGDAASLADASSGLATWVRPAAALATSVAAIVAGAYAHVRRRRFVGQAARAEAAEPVEFSLRR